MEFVTQDLSFEWDKGNKFKNIDKHSVSNDECEELFTNQPVILFDDENHSNIEKRFFVLGKTNKNRKLFICFTIRDNRVRVISARDMSRKERQIYSKYEKNTKI